MKAARAVYDRVPTGIRTRFKALVPDSLLRWYAHQNTDVYLISYPKCGRTWLRLMIGRAMQRHFSLPEDENILLLNSRRRFHPQSPRITVVHDDRPMLKTPQELETDKTRFRSKKVIFLARDPRDVIVSSYFEAMHRSQVIGDNPYEKRTAGFSGSLPEFIDRHVGGFDTLIRYYQIWYANREIPRDFLLIRYEEMKANPEIELQRTLDFLGLMNVDHDTITEAVAFASFENMQRMELEGRFQSAMLRPAKAVNGETYKTRKGKIGNYINYLTPLEIEILNQKMQALPGFYGYNP
jgi:hypothetical protein